MFARSQATDPLACSQTCVAVGSGTQLGRTGTRSASCPAFPGGWEQSCGPDGKDGACREYSRPASGNWQPASIAFLQSTASTMAAACTSPSSFLLGSHPRSAFGLPPFLSSHLRMYLPFSLPRIGSLAVKGSKHWLRPKIL